jgi:hypothetical protein
MKATVTPLHRDVVVGVETLEERATVPHRAYRTTHMPLSGLLASLSTVVAIEAVLFFYWQRLAAAIVSFDTGVVNQMAPGATVVPHAFFGQQIGAMLFGMRQHSQPELITWMVVCALTIVLVSALRRLTKPLQYFINVNALIIGLEAAFLLFAGHLGYSAGTFSQLLLDTMVVTWFVMPLFIGMIALLFPFKVHEAVGLILLSFAYVIFLEAVRYAVFPAILTRTGPILMSDLFLLYGPLLDILPVVGIFGIVLSILSSRLRRTPQAWRWL